MFVNSIVPQLANLPPAILSKVQCIALGVKLVPETHEGANILGKNYGKPEKFVAVAYGSWDSAGAEGVKAWINNFKKERCLPEGDPDCQLCNEPVNLFGETPSTNEIAAGTDITLYESQVSYAFLEDLYYGTLGTRAAFFGNSNLATDVMKIHKGETEDTLQTTPRLWAVYSNLPNDTVAAAVASQKLDNSEMLSKLADHESFQNYIKPFLDLEEIVQGSPYADLGLTIRLGKDYSGFTYQITLTDNPEIVSVAGSSYFSKRIRDEINLVDFITSYWVQEDYEKAYEEVFLEGEPLDTSFSDAEELPACSEITP